MPKQVVFDLESIRLEITSGELRQLEKCQIPNDLNFLILRKLQENIEQGYGIIENWEEVD
jgi:hypothetical protein